MHAEKSDWVSWEAGGTTLQKPRRDGVRVRSHSTSDATEQGLRLLKFGGGEKTRLHVGQLQCVRIACVTGSRIRTVPPPRSLTRRLSCARRIIVGLTLLHTAKNCYVPPRTAATGASEWTTRRPLARARSHRSRIFGTWWVAQFAAVTTQVQNKSCPAPPHRCARMLRRHLRARIHARSSEPLFYDYTTALFPSAAAASVEPPPPVRPEQERTIIFVRQTLTRALHAD